MQRKTDFENLKIGESCIYHEGFLPSDRIEKESKLDKNGEPVKKTNNKGFEQKLTSRALELDTIANRAYSMSNIWVVHEEDLEGNDIIGTGELQLSQKLIKRQFGRRGLPIYQYIAKRIKKASKVIDMLR